MQTPLEQKSMKRYVVQSRFSSNSFNGFSLSICHSWLNSVKRRPSLMGIQVVVVVVRAKGTALEFLELLRVEEDQVVTEAQDTTSIRCKGNGGTEHQVPGVTWADGCRLIRCLLPLRRRERKEPLPVLSKRPCNNLGWAEPSGDGTPKDLHPRPASHPRELPLRRRELRPWLPCRRRREALRLCPVFRRQVITVGGSNRTGTVLRRRRPVSSHLRCRLAVKLHPWEWVSHPLHRLSNIQIMNSLCIVLVSARRIKLLISVLITCLPSFNHYVITCTSYLLCN